MTGRIVILSDDIPAATAFESPLARAGLPVAIATRTTDALALARDGRADVVLIAQDGVADLVGICAELRAACSGTALLAASADDTPLARLRALEAGADEVIRIPVPTGELRLRVAQLAALRHARQGAAALSAIGAPPVEGRGAPRILVVEPDERARIRLQQILSAEADVVAAASAEEALAAMAEASFALAWVSLVPGGPGPLRLCAQFRRLDRTGQLALLALSPPEIEPAAVAAAGFEDLMRSPLDRCEALARTRVALERQTLARLLAHASARSLSGAGPEVPRFDIPVRRRAA